MASNSSFLLILSLLTFSYKAFLLVESNDTLIHNLCNKTPEPVICLQCLHSDPTSKTADAKGLAVIAINCGEFDTTILFNDSFNLYENTSDTDQPLKTMLEQCSENIVQARDSYHGLVVAVQDDAFDVAKASVNNDIIAYVQICTDQFNKYPTVPQPPRILAGIEIVNVDCQIILGILSSFVG
ncbi:PMEI domain-containing protein [Cephalotus follicularis]|uniref:PMEI domain-containing protein n=1 Tax=Cephalotus follicularis TaxID=3775 RepID=A0A1Q3B7Z0_CEPFO|nr:PMEI domain-containing protein [Cephalotus follicularis]